MILKLSPDSSMAEPSAVNKLVVGVIPIWPVHIISVI